MDPSALRFLQLDVSTLGQMWNMQALVAERSWKNRVYSQENRPTLVPDAPSPRGGPVMGLDIHLGKHITAETLTSNIKRNPLYKDTDTEGPGTRAGVRATPTWVLQEDPMGLREDNPKDLDFWLEELYTPGFDSLLKKMEADLRRRKVSKILLSVVLVLCVAVVIVVVPVMVLQNKN